MLKVSCESVSSWCQGFWCSELTSHIFHSKPLAAWHKMSDIKLPKKQIPHLWHPFRLNKFCHRAECTMNVQHSRWKQKKQWRDRGLQWKRQGFHKKVRHYHELSLLSQTKVGTQKWTTSMVHQSPSQFVPRTTCPAPKVVSEQLSSLSSLKSSSNSPWSSKTHLSEEQLDLEINFGGWWKLSPGAL